MKQLKKIIACISLGIISFATPSQNSKGDSLCKVRKKQDYYQVEESKGCVLKSGVKIFYGSDDRKFKMVARCQDQKCFCIHSIQGIKNENYLILDPMFKNEQVTLFKSLHGPNSNFYNNHLEWSNPNWDNSVQAVKIEAEFDSRGLIKSYREYQLVFSGLFYSETVFAYSEEEFAKLALSEKAVHTSKLLLLCDGKENKEVRINRNENMPINIPVSEPKRSKTEYEIFFDYFSKEKDKEAYKLGKKIIVSCFPKVNITNGNRAAPGYCERFLWEYLSLNAIPRREKIQILEKAMSEDYMEDPLESYHSQLLDLYLDEGLTEKMCELAPLACDKFGNFRELHIMEIGRKKTELLFHKLKECSNYNTIRNNCSEPRKK